MSTDTCLDVRVPPLTGPRAHLKAANDVLLRAYERARDTGYQPGGPEMEALCQAETQYQRAKGAHQRANGQ